MPAVRLAERVARPFAGSRVDRDRGVIASVLICGFESANGRDYPATVFRRDFKAYEGRPVNCDHGREPTVDRRLGWFENVAPDPTDGRPRGDFHLLKTHPMYERVMEAAERNPSLYGLSHVALCDVGRKGGREVVEAIRSVESIDLVADPATTKGLWENKPVKTTIRKFLESWGSRFDPDQQKRVRKFLVEMDDAPTDMAPIGDSPMDEPAEGAEPDDALWSGFQSAITAILDQYATDKDASAAVKAITKYLKAHAKLTGGTGGEDSDTTTNDAEDSAAEESRKRTGRLPDPWTVLKECRSARFDPTETQLEFLAAQPDAAKRAAFIKESVEQLARIARADERPRAPGRPQGSSRVTETVTTVPTDAKGFAEFIRAN